MPKVNKILVIRFSSIGDIVLTTPILRCLRKKYPDAQIDFLTKEEFKKVIEGNPHISRILTINKKLNEILPLLKKEKYDFLVDLHKNIRSYRVKSVLKKPSGTFDKLNARKWLIVNFKVNRLPDVHIVDRYFHSVSMLGVENDYKGLEFHIPDEEIVSLADLPSTHRDGYLAFVIGGKHQTKMLPQEKIINICRQINMPVILLGGNEDHASGVKIQQSLGDIAFNACGFYNIKQSASILFQAEKIISNDTGLMHIAAAFNKPIISVWGNTIPEFGMYPYMPLHPERSHIVEVMGLSCRPCSKIGFSKCPRKHFRCMEDISEEEIVEKLNH